MASTRAMLLLVLGLLLCAGQGISAKKGTAETIDSKFQPGEGGVAERTGEQPRIEVVTVMLLILLYP